MAGFVGEKMTPLRRWTLIAKRSTPRRAPAILLSSNESMRVL
jgi:hypothetical protein